MGNACIVTACFAELRSKRINVRFDQTIVKKRLGLEKTHDRLKVKRPQQVFDVVLVLTAVRASEIKTKASFQVQVHARALEKDDSPVSLDGQCVVLETVLSQSGQNLSRVGVQV